MKEILKKFKLPKKIFIPLIVISIGVGIFLFTTKPNQKTLEYATVTRQNIKSIISSSGTLTGKNVANLKFKISGKLAYVNVKVGDQVYKGQVLAGLDTQDLNIALQQAQNAYRAKQASADRVLDDVKSHSTDETFIQKETRTAAEAARDSAFDAVKAAQRDYQDAVIISPINGVVTQAIEISGQNVSGDQITQVVDTTDIYFDTDVDETDINKITIGLPADVTLDAYPNQIFKGTVDKILPQIKTTSTGSNVITVRIKLENPKLTFIQGLSGQADIIIKEDKNALVIPMEALREDNTVAVQTRSGIKDVKLKVGISSDTDVEILSGLSEKERVLLNPPATGINISQNRGGILGNITRIIRGGEGNGGNRFNR